MDREISLAGRRLSALGDSGLIFKTWVMRTRHLVITAKEPS
jgi:hypothetical protein